MKFIIVIILCLFSKMSWTQETKDTIVFYDIYTVSADTVFYKVEFEDYLKELKTTINDTVYEEARNELMAVEKKNQTMNMQFIYYTSLWFYSIRDAVLFNNVIYHLFSNNKAILMIRNKCYRMADVKVKETKAYSCCGKYRSGTDWSIYKGKLLLTSLEKTRNQNAYRMCTCGTPKF